MITMIACISRNGALGKDNNLIYKISEDMKFFKEKTQNNVVVMGRKTYESIGRLLPNRTNIILTRDTDYKVEDAVVVNDIQDVLKLSIHNVFIIGGAEIYELFMEHADRLLLTVVEEDVEEDKCDTWFPKIHEDFECTITNRTNVSLIHTPTYIFKTYERKRRDNELEECLQRSSE